MAAEPSTPSRERARLRRAVGLGALIVVALVVPRPARAASACDEAGSPADRAAAAARVQACYAAGRLGEAITAAEAALARDPGDGALRLELARMATENGDLARADAAYGALLRATPGNLDLRKARADVHAWQGRLGEAVAEYRAVLAADPGNARAHLGLGLALRWQGALGAAERELAAAAEAAPDDPEAANALADLRRSAAFRAWQAEREREAAPDDAGRWLAAIDALEAAEDWDTADARLRAARSRWPADRRLAVRSAQLEQERAARLATRVTAAEAAVAARPDDPALRLELAGALAEQQRLDEAAAEYERYRAARPGDAIAERQLARVLSWAGAYRRSLALYDALVARDPSDASLRLERGRVLAWDGQLGRATRDLEEARAGDPAAAERALGDVWRWAGRHGAAAVHYRRALRLDDPSGEHARAAADYLAAESDVTDARPTVTVVSDSSDFRSVRASIEGWHRLGTASEVAVGIARSDYAQTGDRLHSERLRVSLSHDVGRTWRVGAAYVPVVYDGTHASQNAQFTVERVFGPESMVSLGYDRVDIIDEVLAVDTARGRIIVADRARVAMRHVLPWELQVAADASVAGYSDGNRVVGARGWVTRRLLRVPRLAVRYDVAYLGYADRTDLYWDPASYVTNGGTLILEHAFTPDVRGAIEARIGWGIQDGVGSLERSIGARLELARIGPLSAEVAYQYGETGQVGGPRTGSGYTVHGGTIGIQYRFGAT